jgi:hypothetical protein
VNWSAAGIFALIAFGLADRPFSPVNPRQSTLTRALAGVVTSAVFLASLPGHEWRTHWWHAITGSRLGPGPSP